MNKKYVGTANVINGIAKISWMIPSNWNTGNYSIGADYLGTSKYAISTNTSILTVDPSAYLYLQITSSNKNPKVGETVTITYKLGNRGPDNAINVKMTIPLPSGFIVSNITGDGNWTYNPTTNNKVDSNNRRPLLVYYREN